MTNVYIVRLEIIVINNFIKRLKNKLHYYYNIFQNCQAILSTVWYKGNDFHNNFFRKIFAVSCTL